MKTSLRNRLVKAALLTLAALMLTNLTYAGTPENNKISKSAVKSLTAGLKSENEGLKRSSIYYTGFYKMTETLPVLVEMLENEKNPSNRILISLALKEMNNSEGFEAIKNTMTKETNSKVKRMMSAIYAEYLSNLNDTYAAR